jgi:O-acetyl-ADP-ribose deacetylase (regulator of RNase III)
VSTPAGTFNMTVRMGFVVDVAGYSGRSAREKVDLQQRVSALIDEMLRDLGLELADTYHHGTGDGMVVFLPNEVEVHRALARLLRSAAETVAEDNRRYRDRMRLRMAVVIGPLGPAAIGFSGNTIVEAGRMVDSPVLRTALVERPQADLVVLISDQLHAYVVRERHSGLEAADFAPVDVRTKEFAAPAWLWAGPGAVTNDDVATPGSATFGLVAPHRSAALIGIMTGRILRVRGVDIWVNSENTDMEMPRFNDFSISSVIRYHGARRDAGGRVVADLIADELSTVVGDRRPVAPGSAFVTGSGVLAETNQVRWIIHVASVNGEPGAGFQQVRNVGLCVVNALTQADRLSSMDPSTEGSTEESTEGSTDGSSLSILIPMLGAGVAGGPIDTTATELVDAAVDYLVATPATRLTTIYFLAYSDAERTALERSLRHSPALRPAPAG